MVSTYENVNIWQYVIAGQFRPGTSALFEDGRGECHIGYWWLGNGCLLGQRYGRDVCLDRFFYFYSFFSPFCVSFYTAG